MTNEERRHAVALNEAHMIFGGLETDSHRERIQRARYVRRLDGVRERKPGSLEAVRRYDAARERGNQG